MTSLEMNELTAKAEQSGKNEISAFYPSKINELKLLTQKAEAEQGRDTPKKRCDSADTMDDFSLTVNFVFESWKKVVAPIRFKIYQRTIAPFIVFLKKLKTNLHEITQELIDRYKAYLLEQTDEGGFQANATWIVRHLIHTRTFLNELLRLRILDKNPLSSFHEKRVWMELEQQIQEKRMALISRGEQSSDESLILRYLEFSQSVHPKTFQNTQTVLRFVREYLEEIGLTLKQMNREHLLSLLERIAQHKAKPPLFLKENTFKVYQGRAMHFFKWLYWQGILQDPNFTENERGLFSFEQFKRSRPQNRKTRYYSIKELLKAYNRYIQKSMDYDTGKAYLSALQIFLQFVVSRGKSLYTVDAESIEAFQKYLFEYEFAPGYYYSGLFQSKQIYRVKRFYDWFQAEGYSKNHPLQEYNFKRYTAEISARCAERKKQKHLDDKVPEEFRSLYERVFAYEQTKGFSSSVLEERKRGWRLFFEYLQLLGISEFQKLSERTVMEFQVFVCQYKNAYGKAPSPWIQVRRLVAVRRLLKYLNRFEYMKKDLSDCLELPKNPRGLPTTGMNDFEVRKLLDHVQHAPRKNEGNVIRDRALIETLYSTGMRANELCNVRLKDLDFMHGTVRVNVPKGGIGKQRVIPIGEIACEWIRKYLEEVRKKRRFINHDFIFVNWFGKKISPQSILRAVKNYSQKAGFHKKIVTHSMRVSCATEMFRGKANIKHVQEQLGHSSIQSTEKYLRLVPDDLKKAHQKSHPREKRRREVLEKTTFSKA